MTEAGKNGTLIRMKAELLIRRRIVLFPDAFAEIVVWRLPNPLPPCGHRFKYRVAYIVDGKCVIRFDNERGKGDHRHVRDLETPYDFSQPGRLLSDFNAEVERWNRENGRS